MITGIAITPMYVTGQDQALTFYTQTLGLEVETDVDLGVMRWLTVCVPGQAERRILLSLPGPPAMDPATAGAVRELTAKGATTWTIFHVDDCRATYGDMLAKGVDIVQQPTTQDYGTDMAIRDPFGNQIRFTQLPTG